jgi:hypothetical protein
VAKLNRLLGRPVAHGANAQVDHLDEHREAHRKVDVALRDVLVEAFGEQRQPMSSRKLSASIFTVGCFSTKSLMAPPPPS